MTWAIQVGAVVVLCGFGTALYLSRQVQQGPPRFADTARLNAFDPETTGSIGASARTTQLDPCAVFRGSSAR